MIKKSVEDFKQHIKAKNWIIGATASLFVIVFGLNYVLKFFGYEFATVVQNATDILIFILGTFFIAALLNRLSIPWVDRVTRNTEIENKLLFSKLIGAIFFGSAIVIILWRLGVTGQNIALVLGFTATGFALSIRDVITSFLAWFVLLTKKPFRIQDSIRIEGLEGKVRHIGTFYVVLDENPESDLDFYKVPTTLFIQKPIRNFQNGYLKDSITVKLKDPSSWKKKSEKVKSELSSLLSKNATLSLHIEDKEFVAHVIYEYKLGSKRKVKSTISEVLLETFS